MHVELIVISFLCAVLLLGIIPAFWTSRNVAMLSLILWLFAGNVIQGVNTIVWADNSVVRISVWCDIATKLRLGTQLALPAACLCLCRHLYRCTAGKETNERWRVLSIDCLFCIILPIVYMVLHLIVQDYRFDLIEDFGCEASLYPSVPAILFVWLPPLIICSITFVFASLSVFNYCKYGPILFGTSSGPMPGLPSSTFLRPLATAVVIVAFIVSSITFAAHARIVAAGGLQRWASWAVIHAHLSTVNIISQPDTLELARIELSTWVIPASSAVLVVVSAFGLAYGPREEMLGGYVSVLRWLHSIIFRPSANDAPLDSFMDMHPHMQLGSPTFSIPVHRIKSMWGDTLRSSGSFRAKPAPISISGFSDAPCSPSRSASDESDAFMQSTLTYIESPTGRKALGLLPLQSPPRNPSPSKRLPLPIGARVPPPSPINLPLPLAPPQGLSESADSRPNSILAAAWPRPPSLIPVSPAVPITISPPTPEPSIHHSHRDSVASLSPSVTPSTLSALVSMLEPHAAALPPHHPPFADAAWAPDAPAQAIPMGLPRPVRRARSRDNFVARSLSGGRRERVRLADEFGIGAIYMTVVKDME